MSKVISIHFRETPSEAIQQKLHSICKKIEPDNIDANEPKIVHTKNDFLAIMNPLDSLKIHENSILLGQINSNKEDWHVPSSDFPEGSYAIFRNGSDVSEFITDASASRTIWYYLDDSICIASTSQRAMILFLGGFDFNEQTIPWVLSTGSLGPGLSWDKRISQIPIESSLILDKKNWKIELLKKPINFKTIKRSNKEHKKALQRSLESTFASLSINLDKWVLPLSGGYDSRGILYFMRKTIKTKKIKTITWGLSQSEEIIGNDAYVAKKLSSILHTSHKYYNTDISSEPMEDIIGRFLKVGEGRIDHIGGYMDGFKIWKTLFEDNVKGVIRGDEGFGWSSVTSAANVRHYSGCALCSDYTNLSEYHKLYDLPEQVLPEYMKQKENESLSTWRDRIYHEFRLPTVLSALSDLKLSYVEQANPLLTHNILHVVRSLPDNLRTEKKAFKIIMNAQKPKVEYANSGANASQQDILRSKDLVELIKNTLISDYSSTLFQPDFLKSVVENLKVKNNNKPRKKSRLKLLLKLIVPKIIKNLWHSRPNNVIDQNLLGFRMYIIIYINKLFNEEAKEFN